MAEPTGLNYIAKILGQIYNLHELIRIGGDVYKLDKKDGKYRNKAGKAWTRPQLVDYVKGQKFTAPKTPKATKGELKVDGKTVYKKRDIKGDLKSKAQGLKSRALKIKNKGNQVLQNAKLRVNPNPSEVTRRAGSVNKRIGKGGIISPIIDALLDKTRFADRTANFMTNTMAGQNMNLAERDASKNVNLAALKSGKFREDLNTARNLNKVTQGIKNPEQTGGAIGRSRQDPYIDREPTVSYKPEKVVPGPKQGTDSTNQTETVDKVKIKKTFNPNAPNMGYDTKKSKKKSAALKVNKQLERRKKAIKRAYGNISDKRLNQLLSRAVTQRELEES